MRLRAPFPWFGGKSRVAHVVWSHFGATPNYVEPFAGSLAVLLARPHAPRIETVNDRDCYLANFWRAIQAAPEEVARWADWPVNEADLHARHRWLVDRAEFRERMVTDPQHFDARVAGWWVWGISQWIGGGWCTQPQWTGRVGFGAPRGIHTAGHRQRPDISTGGRGVHVKGGRKRVQLGRGGRGVHRATIHRQLPDLGGDSGASGRGVHASALAAKIPKMDRGTASRLVAPATVITDWFTALSARLRRVRVCCGDWRRILGPSPTTHIGVTGVFLDPPYSAEADRDPGIYGSDDLAVAHAVREWAIANGDNPGLRIALCGYAGEHAMPPSWAEVAWQTQGGYGAQGQGRGRLNAGRERIWFSPHCIEPASAGPLFAEAGA